jgi:hypothetical protein
MPWVGVPRLPSMAPPKVGTAYAYLSWSVLITKPNRLPRRSGDEPCACGNVGVLVGI